MNKLNPVFVNTWQSLCKPGQAHFVYLYYLILQAAVVFLWWPKGTLLQRLENETGPDTLFATVCIIAATIFYYSLRAGVEEITLPEQHSLAHWVHTGSLTLACIVRGYVYAQIVQVTHMILLSSPLLVLAYMVAGDAWSSLLWCLAALVLVAIFYRLLGAIMAIIMGHYEAILFFSVRLAFILLYVLAAAMFPLSSHLLVSSQLLHSESFALFSVTEELDILLFFVFYILLCLLCSCLLYHLLGRQKNKSALIH